MASVKQVNVLNAFALLSGDGVSAPLNIQLQISGAKYLTHPPLPGSQILSRQLFNVRLAGV